MFLRGKLPAVTRIEDGHRAVFGRAVAECSPAVWRLARRLAATRADAEDLFQETFLRAWRGIRRFRGDAAISTWLTRILLNVAHDRRRRARPLPTAVAPPAPTGADPADGLARRELLGRVLAAIDRLPRRQRECLLLKARGGLAVREVAEVLGIGEAAVKSHLLAARKKLVRKFGREVDE